MLTNSDVSLKEQTAKPSLLVEVTNVEKQLVAWIHAKGVMHSDVQDLYRKVCSSYEKIILTDHELSKLQEVEYCLWKLHYRHIDEFRKRIKTHSANDAAKKCIMPERVGATQSSNDDHISGLKLFILEASDFYQNLMIKLRRYYGLPEDFSFCGRDRESAPVEAEKMLKLRFLCHRFLICLGDLARYKEQYENSDIQSRNWSAAVARYLEATIVWPDSGNPQNQLAVLAIYVGDEFLALYHCIRSLAVKEPFPDAWNNLILLFERNRSSQLDSLSSEACFDFLKSSESSIIKDKSQSDNDLSSGKLVKADKGSGETNLWPLVIRMISYFFIKSSLEEFHPTFSSALNELGLLMALDDAKLMVAMKSYQHIDLARTGPYRSLQVAAVFIFLIENLINSPKVKDTDKDDSQQLVLTKLALTATFTFMGRLADRCLKANILESCPLYPALLVFVEWLVSILDKVETYGSDDKCSSAMSYFYDGFLKHLKRLDIKSEEVQPAGFVALWEDHELRGFAPLAQSHVSIDFSTYGECAESFERRSYHRAQRIIGAAMKIANKSNNNGSWISYEKFGKQFYAAESNKSLEMKKESEKGESTGTVVKEEPYQLINIASKEGERFEEKPSDLHVLNKSVTMEEEEVILFKPLQRHNSAPLYNWIISDDGIPLKDKGDQILSADESLQRATSLLIAQNQTGGVPAAFLSDQTSFRGNTSMKQQEPLEKDTGDQFSGASMSPRSPASGSSISSGPPSLNAWVLDKENLNNDRLKGRSDLFKHSLAPIEEIPSASLYDLSISDTNSIIYSRHESPTDQYSSPVYSAPVPSAPLLPDDAVWFNDYGGSGSTTSTNYVFDAPPETGYFAYQPLNYGPSIPGFVDGYPPTRRMTSSEWLRQYRESQNHERATSNMWPLYSYDTLNAGNTYSHDISRPRHFDQWGNPLASNQLSYEERPSLVPDFPPVYGTENYRKEKLFHGYQKPSPYVATANDPEPLLQYLKEKEWRLQQDPALGCPAYTGCKNTSSK